MQVGDVCNGIEWASMIGGGLGEDRVGREWVCRCKHKFMVLPSIRSPGFCMYHDGILSLRYIVYCLVSS